MLAFSLITTAISLLLLLVPIRLEWRMHHSGTDARVEIQVGSGFVRLKRQINLGEHVAMALEHMWKRWRDKGEPVKVPVQKTVKRLPLATVRAAVSRPLRWLGRRTRCERWMIAAEVGAADAMDAALLAGAVWSLLGAVTGVFSQVVNMDRDTPRLQVVPKYAGSTWRLETHCILRVANGYAMFAGVWLLYRVLREKEIRTWALHSWRRKGDVGSGRASDSGADEDGHGEP